MPRIACRNDASQRVLCNSHSQILNTRQPLADSIAVTARSRCRLRKSFARQYGEFLRGRV